MNSFSLINGWNFADIYLLIMAVLFYWLFTIDRFQMWLSLGLLSCRYEIKQRIDRRRWGPQRKHTNEPKKEKGKKKPKQTRSLRWRHSWGLNQEARTIASSPISLVFKTYNVSLLIMIKKDKAQLGPGRVFIHERTASATRKLVCCVRVDEQKFAVALFIQFDAQFLWHNYYATRIRTNNAHMLFRRRKKKPNGSIYFRKLNVMPVSSTRSRSFSPTWSCRKKTKRKKRRILPFN